MFWALGVAKALRRRCADCAERWGTLGVQPEPVLRREADAAPEARGASAGEGDENTRRALKDAQHAPYENATGNLQPS